MTIRLFRSTSQELLGALVWLVSGSLMLLYALLFALGYKIPGVEQVVSLVESIPVEFIYISAFLAIFIEGLYIVGIFFPGTTFVAVFVILAQAGGLKEFFITVVAVFLGWVLSGIVNVFSAHLLRASYKQKAETREILAKDNILLTWFPVFRANYEVAQVLEGAKVSKVLFSSVRARVYASIFTAALLGSVGLFLNIKEINNSEGFLTLTVLGVVVFAVGLFKFKKIPTSS